MALDRLQVAALLGRDQGDRAARLAGAAGAADAVHVDVGRVGDVVVDDVGDAGDVEPAGGDVGGHQQPLAPALEGDHHAVARALGHVAVQRLHAQPLVAEPAGEAVHADLRAREDDRLLGALGLEHLDERVGLVAVGHLDVELGDGVDRERGGAAP